jgi:hypothetical protein
MGAVLVLWPAGLLVAASAIPSSSCGQCGRDASEWRCRAVLDARGEVLFCLVQTAVGRRDASFGRGRKDHGVHGLFAGQGLVRCLVSLVFWGVGRSRK